ncbi:MULTISPECIES: CocE/NonD family hydrolase [unclassified Roseovarius]|uniref:CocE/NonD family hydrolase n=1 Tax=unclassified Roseovarius TaxID=2614913 RepID=UPI00273EAFC0|nr:MULTISPECIES: CocE/NonD family hydrolase [unclassified Roseovarius]
MIIHPDMAITLPDGTRLSARVWMPDNAESEPVPAILEYLPYRKSDGTAARDHGMHLHFARAGYACLRVDRRGCGDSEGLFDDEYSEQELQDGVDIINWIAAQPWCTGKVGIQGISWGGFNGLQIAARAPEALKAVISIGTTVDRYHDDIHYKGGIQLSENIGWAATVSSWFSMPPDPALRPDWREMWLQRLENAPFLASRWMHHADRDDYWKHGSVCEDYGAIKAPVLVMGGLHDGYRNAMAALVGGMSAPVKGVAGPWNHKYPNISTIEPSIDYLGKALRWWDHWLKGVDTGVEADPTYRTYVMDSIKPDPALSFRPGRWFGLKGDPRDAVEIEELGLGDGTLGHRAPFSAELVTDLRCGRSCGEFFPFGFGPGELPDDQNHDDRLSLCFESEPTSNGRDLFGAPELTLQVAANGPRAQIAARLCDVRPDGTSALITMGLLNLRHRNGFDAAEELVANTAYDVSLNLDQASYHLPAGHRLRLAISGSYWPFCWPEGQDVTLTISGGTLSLPWLDPDKAVPVDFDPPVEMEERAYQQLKTGNERKEWREDPASGRQTLEISGDHGRRLDTETGLITESAVSERWEITPTDPASAQVEITWTRSLGRGDWEVSSKVVTRMRGEADAFVVHQHVEAFEGTQKVFDRQYSDTIPR